MEALKLLKCSVSLENPGLSASKEGRSAILASTEMVEALLRIAKCAASSPEDGAVTNDAILTLVNLTAEPSEAQRVYEVSKQMQPVCVKFTYPLLS